MRSGRIQGQTRSRRGPQTLDGVLPWFLVALLLTGTPLRFGRPVGARPAHSVYAGWAVEAYPELSLAEMESMIQRQVDAGANVVWVGHNNPGEAVAGKAEPGLSYAIYEAYSNPSDPRHDAAADIVRAQHRMLAACRAAGVKAVLPIGYQIQMGQTWNELHPGDLRMDARGLPLDIYGGGVSASFYAPAYREAILDYYRWVDTEFVAPYADVILMLNLADEPIGGDYGPHAEAEFQKAHGFGFDDVSDYPERQQLLGAFQSRYVVEYAIYSAGLWQDLEPDLPVTMSFDGGQARATFTMPEVEALFRDTPPNFVVTFDAYPRDGLPTVAMQDHDLIGLILLVRSLGVYSARYDKPVWLWAAANSWGLSQASPDPGTVSDALANGLYLALLARQGGGHLQGIAYWNYNVKGQGLYNDKHTTAYDVETMFRQVSALLPRLRALMVAPAGAPSVIILSPPGVAHRQIGQDRAAYHLQVQPYQRLEILAKQGVPAAVVSRLGGWNLEGVRAIVVLSPTVEYLAAQDIAALRTYVAGGGHVVCSPEVGGFLAGEPWAPSGESRGGLVESHGDIYVAQEGMDVLFEQARADTLTGFWQEVLGVHEVWPGFRVVTETLGLYYHIGQAPAWMRFAYPFEARGYRHDEHGRRAQAMTGALLCTELGRREFILLRRARRSQPWMQ